MTAHNNTSPVLGGDPGGADGPADPEHTDAIAELLATGTTKAGLIAYAIERARVPAVTADVVAWLHLHGGVDDPARERPRISTLVHKYRRERDLAATGELPRVPPARPEHRTEQRAEHTHEHGGDRGGELLVTGVFYAAAVLAMAVSADTAFRYFGAVLHIAGREQWALFGVGELALLACTLSMRQAARRGRRPAAPRLLMWSLCAISGYMAVSVSGFGAGIARVALGPALAVVLVHLALGVDLRAARRGRTGTLARVGAELRERLLSRLGLGDEHRSAAERTRERAVRRVGRLANTRCLRRRRRLARAVHRAGVATDPAARARLLAEVATARHTNELITLQVPSPWTATGQD